MKALFITKFGSPKHLTFKDVDIPAPAEGEVLIKVRAASINAADIEWMKGLFFVRFMGSPKHRILGSDMSGVVVSTGSGAVHFKPGDEVMADLYSIGMGAFGEYVCVNESVLAAKPKAISFMQAATIPQAGVLALQGLKDAEINRGGEVLINGAGGGIGSFALQIAKTFGAIVTGVDRADKFDFISSLGADFCIDYTQQDYTQSGKQYDLILDLNANHRISAYRRVLKEGGRFVVGGGKVSAILGAHIAGSSAKTNQNFGLLMWKPNDRSDISEVIRMVKLQKITPAIDRVYKFDQAIEAIKYCWGQNAKGKVVISMD